MGSMKRPNVRPEDVATGATAEGASAGSPSSWRTFDSLRVPAYRYLWLAMLMQMGGMQVQMLARGFFVFDLTGSAKLLGLVTAAASGPALLFMLFGGVMADRFDKRRLIQTGQVVSLAAAIFVAVSISTGTVTWQHLLVASVGQGVVMAMVMPARHAIVAEVVGKSGIQNGIALNSLGMSVVTMAGPGVAGILIGVIDVEGVYYVITCMFAISIVLTQMVPASGPTARSAGPNVLSEIADGFRYVRARSTMMLLLALRFSTMAFGMPLIAILPIIAKGVFEVGAAGLGLMSSVIGVGSLVGALTMASMGKSQPRGLLVMGAGMLTGASLMGLSLIIHAAPVFSLGLVCLFSIGVLQAGRIALNQTLVLELAEPLYQGRVMGVFALSTALMPASVLPVAVSIDLVGASLTLACLAGAIMAVVGAIYVWSPSLRRLQ